MPCPLCSHDKIHKQGFNEQRQSKIPLSKLQANIHAIPLTRFTIGGKSVRRKCGLSYSHIVKEPVCVVLVG
ncbi:MAG: hypothetical protein CLLPBCKN_000081 [Chroococcidiopsis cubana SAG 39.79]|nr:hypothetical protein [Chroococcidiopsis cubana SAG 39.79]